jgi:hypothetical protein
MTPAEERFIALWNAGTETAEIARQLGIKATTAQSRAYRLQLRGLIQPRPRGGAYPTQRARTRSPLALSETTDSPPVHNPVQRTVHRPVHNSAPVQTPVHNHPDHPPASSDLSGVLNALVERLSAIEETLKQGGVQRTAPVQEYAPVQPYAPVQDYALPGVEPPRLSAEDRKSERWNLYMPRWIRRRIERAAALEGMSPSQFLQRLCGPWAATWQDPEAEP